MKDPIWYFFVAPLACLAMQYAVFAMYVLCKKRVMAILLRCMDYRQSLKPKELTLPSSLDSRRNAREAEEARTKANHRKLVLQGQQDDSCLDTKRK